MYGMVLDLWLLECFRSLPCYRSGRCLRRAVRTGKHSFWSRSSYVAGQTLMMLYCQTFCARMYGREPNQIPNIGSCEIAASKSWNLIFELPNSNQRKNLSWKKKTTAIILSKIPYPTGKSPINANVFLLTWTGKRKYSADEYAIGAYHFHIILLYFYAERVNGFAQNC